MVGDVGVLQDVGDDFERREGGNGDVTDEKLSDEGDFNRRI